MVNEIKDIEELDDRITLMADNMQDALTDAERLRDIFDRYLVPNIELGDRPGEWKAECFSGYFTVKAKMGLAHLAPAFKVDVHEEYLTHLLEKVEVMREREHGTSYDRGDNPAEALPKMQFGDKDDGYDEYKRQQQASQPTPAEKINEGPHPETQALMARDAEVIHEKLQVLQTEGYANQQKLLNWALAVGRALATDDPASLSDVLTEVTMTYEGRTI